MKKNQPIDLFRKWIVRKSEYKTDDGSWILFDRFPRARWTWEFSEDRNSFQDGTVESAFDGKKSPPDEVWFNMDTRELCIDVSWRDADGYKHDVEEEYFRVERKGSRALILYSLEYVASEPDDYRFRLILTRFTIASRVSEMLRSIYARRKYR